MKKILIAFTCFCLAQSMTAQSWNLTLNTVTGSPNFGTASNHPINFFTNGTQKMTLTTAGLLKINSLAGTSSRFVRADALGNLMEWTGSALDFDKILFGDGTWGTYPFKYEAGNVYLSNGATRLGIGVTSPAAALDVSGDVKASGSMRAPNGFLFTSTQGITYDPTSSSFIMGIVGQGLPAYNNCLDLPSLVGSVLGGAFITGQDYTASGSTAATNVRSALRMFVLPTNGSGYIDLDGKSNTNQTDNVLYMNYYCGRNTAINTGSNGGIVYIGTGSSTAKLVAGDFVSMRKHLEIGDPTTGIVNATNNTALDINVNSGKGLRFNTITSTIPLLTTEYNSTNVFSLFGDGQMQLSTANTNALVVKDPNFSNTTSFELQSDGTAKFSPSYGSDAIQVSDVSGGAVNFKVEDQGLTTISPTSGNALIVKNGPTGPKTFNVGSNGFTEITTAATKAFAIYNASNSNYETFSVNKDGYTEIKVYSPTLMPTPYSTGHRAFTIRDMSVGSGKDVFVVNSDGYIFARGMEISVVNDFPDYVFSKDYKLKSIQEVADFIEKNKRLPGFEEAKYYEERGINVNDMFVKQQEKIEELMLYIIQLEKRLQSIEKK